MKLGAKIVLVFAIVILIGATIIYVGVQTYGENLLESAIADASKTFGEGILYRIERTIYEKLLDIEWFSNSHTPQHFLTEIYYQGNSTAHPLSSVNEDLISFSASSDFWDEISLVDTSGIILASSALDEIGKSIEEDDLDGFSIALSGESYISDIYLSKQFGPTIEFMIPVKEYDTSSENIVGVMVAHLKWEQIQELIKETERDAMFHKFALLNKDGRILYSSEEEAYLQKSDLASLHEENHEDINGEYLITKDSNNKRDALITFSHTEEYEGLRDLKWTFIVINEAEEVFSPIKQLNNFLIIIVLIASVICFAIDLIFSKTITKPILELNEISKKIGKKNFDVKSDIKRNDEIGTLANSIDKMAQDLGKLEKEETNFLNIISHELRTPLTPTFAQLDILESSKNLKKKEKQSINAIRRNSERLFSLIENIIEFTQIESKRIDIEKININVKEEIESVIAKVKEIYKNKKIPIRTKIDSNSKTINTDKEIFEKIITRILDNSMKFADKGEILIETKKEKNNLIINITDSGMGIPKNKLKDIFNKFSHVESYLTRSHEGAGLGLSLTKGLVEKISGEIKIKSEEGVGTTVSIKIPIN